MPAAIEAASWPPTITVGSFVVSCFFGRIVFSDAAIESQLGWPRESQSEIARFQTTQAAKPCNPKPPIAPKADSSSSA